MSGMGFAPNSVETSEDLHTFQLVNREHLSVVREKVQKMERLRFAQQVRTQLIEEI